jgi:adenosylcobinamide-GDP ribazoletransferase
MNTQWRLLMAALRFDTHLAAAALRGGKVADLGAGARYFPVAGALLGAAGGAAYWLGTQLWPTSVAVVLSLLVTTAMSGARYEEIAGAEQPPHTLAHETRARAFGMVAYVFALLLKYNALMALSAAGLPFAAPANVALGFIMICGHAAGCAVIVSLIASPTGVSSTRISNGDLGVALVIGFAPAALLGIPGLVGLAAAILARVGYGTYIRRNSRTVAGAELYAAQQLCEICFYLGALASWTYV